MEDAHGDPSPNFGEGIPWAVGINVPWTVAWSGEGAFGLRRSTVFPGMIEVTQDEHQGVGLPAFAVNHVERQRRGLALHLCHMCGEPTLPEDRQLFPVVSGGFVTMADGTRQYGGNVPPVHGRCATLARRQCPHLRRLVAEPLPYPDEEPRLIPRTDIVPGMEALARTLPPDIEVVFSCYRLFSPAFSRRVENLMGTA
ncbi:MAG TPA: hypothetical protein VII63_10530 [Caulobacteraceae bacterium]